MAWRQYAEALREVGEKEAELEGAHQAAVEVEKATTVQRAEDKDALEAKKNEVSLCC